MSLRLLGCVVLAWMILLGGCASIIPEIDPPKITLEGFNPLPSQGGAPRFEIKLRIANPNNQTFDIAGISYGVEIQGKELMSGVSNDVPLLEPYSEEVITLEAGLQLFQLLRLLTSLGKDMGDSLDYRFTAKIDFNGFVPTQRVEETGSFTLK
ncbi:MAG: LEA type 2 family protein [Halioglobus sp.]